MGIVINMRLAGAATAFLLRTIDCYSAWEDVKSRRDVVVALVVSRPDASDHSQSFKR